MPLTMRALTSRLIVMLWHVDLKNGCVDLFQRSDDVH